jgi:hypothetical protein
MQQPPNPGNRGRLQQPTKEEDSNMSGNDNWGFSSGLPLDDVDVTIVKASFGYNAQIGDGKALCANITFQTDDGDDHEQSFSVGDGWNAKDKGASIDGRKTLNQNTNYGRFMASAVKALVDGGVQPGDVFPEGYKVIGAFVGTQWHLGTEKVMSTNPVTGVQKETSKIITTKYLGGGVADGAGEGAKAPAKKAGGKETLEDSNPKLFLKLVTRAGKFTSHDDFMEAVMDEYEYDKLALNAIMAPAGKAGSVWGAKVEAEGEE